MFCEKLRTGVIDAIIPILGSYQNHHLIMIAVNVTVKTFPCLRRFLAISLCHYYYQADNSLKYALWWMNITQCVCWLQTRADIVGYDRPEGESTGLRRL